MNSYQQFNALQRAFFAVPFEDERIANGLLQIGAVELRPQQPFTWSSGWKSPIYCDNRLILGFPILRDLVIDGFQTLVEKTFPSVDLIVGTATAGIPHAAILAERLNLPMAYVRSSAKEHGQQKRTEGKIRSGANALVIEDTLSTGKSSYAAVNALQEEGVHVLAVSTILSYDFAVAAERILASQVPAYRLVGYDTLIRIAIANGYVSQMDESLLLNWREAPESFGTSI